MAILLSGCGGSDHTGIDDDHVRYYATTYRNDQLLALMTFKRGLTYGFYQADFSQSEYPKFAYSGFFVSASAHAGRSINQTGYEFKFDVRGSIPITISDVAVTDDSLVATMESPATRETISASRAYGDALVTNTAILAGDYAVEAQSVAAGVRARASVTPSGALQAELGSGCTAVFQLTSHPTGNVYSAAGSLGPSCTLGRGVFTGHAMQNASTRFVYVLLTNDANDGVMLLLVPRSAPTSELQPYASLERTPSPPAELRR